MEKEIFSKELIDSCICNDLMYYDWEIDKKIYIILNGELWKVYLDFNGNVKFAKLEELKNAN
ncbi:MAG TPA: hypothetical protein ENI02_02965 [Candidatus Aminicenantes bacterium]|nr:hypothetical protein [Candidatus Aminicenantes bacterium]